MSTKFAKLKGLPYQSLINQSLLRKPAVSSGLKSTFALEVTPHA